MMNINRYHVYFWSIHYAFIITLDYFYFKEQFNIIREVYMMFVQLSIFYSFLFALVRFRKTNFWTLTISIIRFLLSFGLILFLNHFRGKLSNYYGQPMHISFGELLNDTLAYYNVLAFYALGYYYLMGYGTKQRELKETAEQKVAAELAKAQLQQDLLQVENNFLRAQINPHFLYNTLNLFYAKALPANKELANGILTLADIMQYSLETTENNQLVPLQMEVAHLRRVIDIHQLRFNKKLNIDFTVEGPYDAVSVAPLIFITLLENALKHGELNNPAHPVTMWLSIDAHHIHFTIRNKKSTNPPEHSHGIGLENVKKRLDNIYGSNYSFNIKETDEEYEVELNIKYNRVSEI